VLFEKAVYPAMKKNLPIRLRNFLSPGIGTVITKEGSAQVVSSMRNIVMINVREMPGLSSIVTMLEQFGSANADDPVTITQASRNDISLVTVERYAEAVANSAKRLGNCKVDITKGLGLVAIVGSNLGIPQVYELLQREKIQSHAVVRTASRRSILIVTHANDAERTTRAMHDRLSV
jgi:aspartokinase